MGVPSPTVEFEFTPGTWTTVTDRLRKPVGLSITRGRGNELETFPPGTASFSLQNNDGAFSYGVAGAYPVRRYVPVRISTSGRRFTGYVDSWSVSVSQRGKLSDCAVTCVDRMALDSLQVLRGHANAVINSLSPLAYWDLTGELTGGQVPGGAADPMIPGYSGTAGGELGWGGGDTLAGDDSGGVRFTPAVNDTTSAMVGGYRLSAQYFPPVLYSVIVMYGKAVQDGPLLRLGGAQIDAAGGSAVWLPASGPPVPLVGPVEVFSISALGGVVLSSDPTLSTQQPARDQSTTTANLSPINSSVESGGETFTISNGLTTGPSGGFAAQTMGGGVTRGQLVRLGGTASSPNGVSVKMYGFWMVNGQQMTPTVYSPVATTLGTTATDIASVYLPPAPPEATALRVGMTVESTGTGRVVVADGITVIRLNQPAAQVGGTLTAGVAAWSGSSVSHVAVVPYINPANIVALRDRLAMKPTAVETVTANLLALSGAGSVPVTRYGSARTVVGTPTSGKSAQDAINDIAVGALGRYFIDRGGEPDWQAYDYAPAATPLPADAGVLPDVAYEVDVSAWVTDVTTSLPSGGSYTFSDATGLARPSMSIQHVLPTDAEARAVATTIVDRSTDTPRLRDVGFDLLRLPGAQATALLNLELGARLTVSGLPPQIPSPQTVVVEGISEVLTERSWVLEFTTSPDPDLTFFAWGNAWGAKHWKPF